MLRRVYIIITNRSINNPTITVNDQPYNYGDVYEEGSVLNIRVTASKYSEYNQRVTVPNNNLVLNIELSNSLAAGDFVNLTSDQTIAGLKTFSGGGSLSGSLILKSNRFDFNNVTNGNIVPGSFISMQDKNNVSYADLRAGVGSISNVYNQLSLQIPDASLEYLGLVYRANNGITEINASANVKNSITGLAFPSESFTELTLPSSGSSLIPSNHGFISMVGISSAASNYIHIGTHHVEASAISTVKDQNISCHIPVRKGQDYTLKYNTPSSKTWIWFVNAYGS